jgi:RNA polymerase sigma-54 factor
MALEIKQSLRLSQQLVMTPQLQQAIKLLQLNRMELQEVVTQEMMENPILEELAETRTVKTRPLPILETSRQIRKQNNAETKSLLSNLPIKKSSSSRPRKISIGNLM